MAVENFGKSQLLIKSISVSFSHKVNSRVVRKDQDSTECSLVMQPSETLFSNWGLNNNAVVSLFIM